MDSEQRKSLDNSLKAMAYLLLLFVEIRKVCRSFLKSKNRMTVRTLQILKSIHEDGVLRVLARVRDNHPEKKTLYEACPVEKLLREQITSLEEELKAMGD